MPATGGFRRRVAAATPVRRRGLRARTAPARRRHALPLLLVVGPRARPEVRAAVWALFDRHVARLVQVGYSPAGARQQRLWPLGRMLLHRGGPDLTALSIDLDELRRAIDAFTARLRLDRSRSSTPVPGLSRSRLIPPGTTSRRRSRGCTPRTSPSTRARSCPLSRP
jgi:hypothetical protein